MLQPYGFSVVSLSVLALSLRTGILPPMGIWVRLGNVIKSYLSEVDSDVSGGSYQRKNNDPDLDAAYEELNDFLGDGDSRKKSGSSDAERKSGSETAGEHKRPVPEELKKDFAELGLAPNTSLEECKTAYKKLLKSYHPDRHVGDPEKLKEATEKTARINAAYDRIEKWYRDNSP